MSEDTLFDGQEKEVAVTAELVKAAEKEQDLQHEEGIVALAKADIGAASVVAKLAAEANALVDIKKAVMQAVIKATNEQDWVDQDGKPYLMASGAEKIAPFFNAGIKDMTFTKDFGKDEKGEWYRYIYNATAFVKNKGVIVHEMPVIGTCSSRDKFFGKKDGEYKSLTEIDISNIQKKARTNCYVNGISRILGLRNLTWAELEAAGLRRGKTPAVNYGNTGSQTQETKDLKEKLEALINKILALRGLEVNATTKAEMLKELTMWEKDGEFKWARDIAKMSEKWVQTTYGKAKKLSEELEAKATGGTK